LTEKEQGNAVYDSNSLGQTEINCLYRFVTKWWA